MYGLADSISRAIYDSQRLRPVIYQAALIVRIEMLQGGAATDRGKRIRRATRSWERRRATHDLHRISDGSETRR
jgi:hypothetical protein